MKSIITTLIKTISSERIKNCKLYETKGFDKCNIADCKATIKILRKEHIVNNNKYITHQAFITLNDNIVVKRDIDDDSLLQISSFEISADIYDNNGIYIKKIFNKLSGINIKDDTWTFEILDNNLVIKLRDEF